MITFILICIAGIVTIFAYAACCMAAPQTEEDWAAEDERQIAYLKSLKK